MYKRANKHVIFTNNQAKHTIARTQAIIRERTETTLYTDSHRYTQYITINEQPIYHLLCEFNSVQSHQHSRLNIYIILSQTFDFPISNTASCIALVDVKYRTICSTQNTSSLYGKLKSLIANPRHDCPRFSQKI